MMATDLADQLPRISGKNMRVLLPHTKASFKIQVKALVTFADPQMMLIGCGEKLFCFYDIFLMSETNSHT